MRDKIIAELTRLAEIDERIYLITGDLGYVVLDPFREKFPQRFINVGIAEQNMTALAAGMALEGNIVFTYSLSNFPTMRCLEQIRNDICYHKCNINIICVGGGLGLRQSRHYPSCNRGHSNYESFAGNEGLRSWRCIRS